MHHLLVALAAAGWTGRVRRLPDPLHPDHLATVEITPHATTSAEADLATAIPLRRTDRRRFTSWPVPGEVTSAVLLTATRAGLASSPLTQPLEVENTRDFVRNHVLAAKAAHPQILLRLGWPPPDAAELPATPRRPPGDVVIVSR